MNVKGFDCRETHAQVSLFANCAPFKATDQTQVFPSWGNSSKHNDWRVVFTFCIYIYINALFNWWKGLSLIERRLQLKGPNQCKLRSVCIYCFVFFNCSVLLLFCSTVWWHGLAAKLDWQPKVGGRRELLQETDWKFHLLRKPQRHYELCA